MFFLDQMHRLRTCIQDFKHKTGAYWSHNQWRTDQKPILVQTESHKFKHDLLLLIFYSCLLLHELDIHTSHSSVNYWIGDII